MRRILAIAVFVAAVAVGYSMSAQAYTCHTNCYSTIGGNQSCNTICY
jgi:hypothetical protein